MFPVKFKRCLRAVLDVVLSSFDRKVQSISLYTITNRSAHIKSHVGNYTSLPHNPHNVTQVRLSIPVNNRQVTQCAVSYWSIVIITVTILIIMFSYQRTSIGKLICSDDHYDQDPGLLHEHRSWSREHVLKNFILILRSRGPKLQTDYLQIWYELR